MVTTTARPETGAAIKLGPMVTAPPDRSVREDDLREFAAGTGLAGPFLADQLAAFIAHERAGVNLLHTLHARADNPALRSRYSHLVGEVVHAVDVWERLIRDLGGNPQYISPAARSAEALDTKMIESLALSGSADPMTFEQAGVQAYLEAANQRVVNARLLGVLAREADDGPGRRAMQSAAETLTPICNEHAAWALKSLETMTVQQARHPIARKVGQAAEKVMDAARSAIDRVI